MAKSKTRTVYTCQECAAQTSKWQGRCFECGAWNSLVEEVKSPEPATRGWSTGSRPESSTSVVLSLNHQPTEVQVERRSTGFKEFDRVLGGGFVRGSFTLLGGDPGIGKSTLLMQMAGGLAKDGASVLYVSGEESVEQTAMRARRLGVKSEKVNVAAEGRLETILDLTRSRKPDVLVVDSIQTVYLSELTSAPGSVSQVRECAGRLMTLAKTEGITVVLIGHVTKEGQLAGPKVLEHMVDTVLAFEGDAHYQFRLLRTLKNRFGRALELGVFEMQGQGLLEVTNPSEMFLQERATGQFGSAVLASLEGTRPLLCEVQALVTPTPMAMPRRTSIGLDNNRLHLLTAVLSKQMGFDFSHSDIFLNVVGGLKLLEPAADLSVVAALISSSKDVALSPQAIFFGEVGLTGEVRAVPFADLRVREAAKLGFQKFFVPASNRKHLKEVVAEIKGEVVYIKTVPDLFDQLGVQRRSPRRSTNESSAPAVGAKFSRPSARASEPSDFDSDDPF